MHTIPMRILIDGECPLCAREARFLEWLDRGRGRLIMEDIAAEGFEPSRYRLTMDEVMGAIHAIGADGSTVVGMEVFRRAYAAVGLGWTIAWTAWWPFRPIVDRFYVWFAKNRMRLTGRGAACDTGRCRVTPGSGPGASVRPADR
jgi:predicted DCC family thiol-disulfide oxidoreductase YuxK